MQTDKLIAKCSQLAHTVYHFLTNINKLDAYAQFMRPMLAITAHIVYLCIVKRRKPQHKLIQE